MLSMCWLETICINIANLTTILEVVSILPVKTRGIGWTCLTQIGRKEVHMTGEPALHLGVSS